MTSDEYSAVNKYQIEVHKMMNDMIVCMYRKTEIPDLHGRMKKMNTAGRIKIMRYWVKLNK